MKTNPKVAIQSSKPNRNPKAETPRDPPGPIRKLRFASFNGPCLLLAAQVCCCLMPLATRAQVPLATALDWTNVWSTGYSGDVWQYNPWFGQTLTNHDGVDAAQSGDIGHNMTNWIQTTATVPGFLAFWWKVSSESCCDKLRFAINGVEKTNIAGYQNQFTNWFPQAFDLPEGANTLRWSYSKDGSLDGGYDAGWVDQVRFIPGLTMVGAADNGDLIWTVGGDGIWFPQTNTFHFDGDALQSGMIGDSQTHWIQTAANGPVFMRFWWKVSSETNRDVLEIYCDSVLQASISGEVDWEERSVYVPAGRHTFQWRYSKNGRAVAGQDAAWLDAVEFYVPDEPFIGTQPTNQIVWAGQRATFAVGVLGAQPLTNQWRFNGAIIPGGTNATLVLPPAQTSDAGVYSVVVSNAFGHAASSNATLTVLTGPTFTEGLDVPPELNWTSGGDAPWFTETNVTHDLVDAAQSGAISQGQQSWLQASVTLTNPAWLNFWWRATDWADTLGLEINGTNVVSLGGGSYWSFYSGAPLRAGTNVLRWVYSRASASAEHAVWLDQVSLTNILAPIVLARPQSRVVLEGTPIMLAADVLGAAPLTMQWFTNDVAIPGATSGALSLGNVTPHQSATYSMTASNEFGFTNLTATLTVVPFQDYTAALESGPLVWDNSCTEWPWFVQTTNTHDGDAAQSGAIPHSRQTWLQTTVTGPGRISFRWSISSQTNGDALSFSIDAAAKRSISGQVPWQLQSFDVPSGAHSLLWLYAKNSSVSTGLDAAFLDAVQFTPGPTFFEALDDTNRVWTVGGPTHWFVQTNVTHDDSDAAQSGALGSNETNWIETTASGPAMVSFWWRISSETNGDFALFTINGGERTNISGEVDWRQEVFYVPYGTQTLRWSYAKNASNTNGVDAVWLDRVWFSTNLDSFPLPPEASLVAWYPFSGNARDESGHSNHGTLYGPPSPAYDRSYSGTTNSYLFGSGNYVDCGNGASLYRLSNFTVTAWIRPSSVTGFQQILTKHTSDGAKNGYAEFDLYMYNDGAMAAFLGDGVNTDFPETLLYSGSAGKLTSAYTWYHVALTVGNTQAVLYLNGALVATDTVVPSHRQYGTRPLQIGRFNNGSASYYNGRIDEVRVYNIALSSEQILGAMDADVLPPRLIAAPVSITTNQCANVTLAGFAFGASSLRYQWLKDSVPLPGETNAVLLLTNVTPSHAGNYSMLVTNFLGSATGLVAQLTVAPLGLGGDLSWTVGGNAYWFGQTNVTRDGLAAQSGRVTNNGTTWIETAVSGPGTLRYWWKVSSEAGYDGLTNWLDGGVRAGISGEVDWQLQTLAIPPGRHTVRWTYAKDNVDLDPVGQDAGWLDQVDFATDTPPVSLADALDNTNLVWSTTGNDWWFGQTNTTHDGADAARSGYLTNSQQSILEGAVNGPGVLRFWSKVSSEERYDFLIHRVDGLDVEKISGEADWQERLSFVPSGAHTLAWIYKKDSSFSEGADAGWVDQVSFIPTAGPWIVQPPQPQPAMVGDLAQFDVVAFGVEPLAYQWRRGEIPLPGETNSWLQVQPVQPPHVGEYSVRITNPSNTTDSVTAALTLLPLKLAWQRGFGGTGSDSPLSVLQTADGGFLVGGWSDSTNGNRAGTTFGNEDFWVLRLGAGGELLWERSFGGTADDELRVILPTSDGGFLLAGNSFSGADGNKTNANFGARDFWAVRIDAAGNRLWDRAYGGTGNDLLYCASALPDGGFALAGCSASPSDANKTSPHFGDWDFWLVRLDANGNTLWDRSYGGTAADAAITMGFTADGGFLLAGYSESPPDANKTSAHFGDEDFWLVRTDISGSKLWETSFGGTNLDRAIAIQPASGGGWLVGGQSYSGADGNKTNASFGDSDFWVVQVNTNGIRQWEHAYGGSDYEALISIAPAGDGGFLLAGKSFSGANGSKERESFGWEDVWLVRVDAEGQRSWEYSFGGTDDDWFTALVASSDGGFLLAAATWSDPDGNKTTDWLGAEDLWLIKLETYSTESACVRLVRPECVGTNFCFRFQTQTNQGYTVEYNDDLNTTNWRLLQTVPGDGSLYQCLAPMTNTTQRFFRVRRS